MDPEPSLFLIAFISDFTLITGFILLFVLLLCSAFVSGAEVALFSISKHQLDEALASKSRHFKIIAHLLNKPQRLLATILVANNFINIGVVLLFAYLSDFIFGGMTNDILRFIIEVGLVTFLILLFGEILPKVYASRNNLKFATFMAYPLRVLDALFSPISVPMQRFTKVINDRLGKQKSNFSVDQLSHALELTSDEDTTIEEQKILEGIVAFGNTDTKQVMRPRIDVFALDVTMKYEEVLSGVISNEFSRIPVYEENVDNIKGILYAKDLLPYIDRKQFEWTSLLREPFFVPENKKLDDLMAEFQEKKIHLAVVVDEYGGTSGLVSLQDVIEEIVGDISDEFDDDDLIYSKLDEKNFVFEGKTNLKDFYRIIQLDDEDIFEDQKGEAETLAGFILENSGQFPRPNSKIYFENFVFTIESLDKKRIIRIKVTLP